MISPGVKKKSTSGSRLFFRKETELPIIEGEESKEIFKKLQVHLPTKEVNHLQFPEWKTLLDVLKSIIATNDKGLGSNFEKFSFEYLSTNEQRCTLSMETVLRDLEHGKPLLLTAQVKASQPKTKTPYVKIPENLQKKEFDLLEGEVQKQRLSGASLLQKTSEGPIIFPHGIIVITNYQIIFKEYVHTVDNMSEEVKTEKMQESKQNSNSKGRKRVINFETEVYIPLMLISSAYRKSRTVGDQIKLYCYDMRDLKITLPPKEADILYEYVQKYLSPPEHFVDNLFAFHYRFAPSNTKNGWSVYRAKSEFARMGLLDDQNWDVVNWNISFELCSTYPRTLCIPKSMQLDEVKQAAEFRSKARIPVLTWKHPSKPVTITRCSQPHVGIVGRTSKADEKLVRAIFSTNTINRTYLQIIDARPAIAAVGNKAKGYGYEYDTDYCKVDFMNIENIHAMRESWTKLFQLLYKDKFDENNWLSNLEATGWTRHIAGIMEATSQIIDTISEGVSVLIHCSDGWDRTSQLSSLAQLCLDPYYRTLEGMQVLIEKDWVSFGHKFAERCGHEGTKENEKSPIFLQWLECVFQLTHQFPTAFEFNGKFLVLLADEVYTARFGTFLFNCDAERQAHKLHQLTVSLWTYVNHHRDQYVSAFYSPVDHELRPSFRMRKLAFWEDFYFRYEGGPLKKRTDMQKAALDNLTVKIKTDIKKNSSITKIENLFSVQGDSIVKEILDGILNRVFEHVEAVVQKEHSEKVQYKSTGEGLLEEIYGEGSHGKPTWIPDEWASNCSLCNKKFTQINRRHHCRSCGGVFCSSCSGHRVPIPKYKITSPVRVCDGCFDSLSVLRNTTEM